MFVALIRWLEKPPDPLVVQTHEPKTRVVPAQIAGKSKSKDAIEFSLRSLAKAPTWRASCQCLAAKLSEVYPEKIDCRQGLTGIRTRRCKEHKDLDRFRPPEHNILRHVWLFVLPLGSIDDRDVYRVFWRGPCLPLYILGDRFTWKVLAEYC